MKKKAEAKHTPTPWKATMVLVSGRGKQSIFRPWITTTDGDRGICEIFVSGNDGRNITSEDRANAAFIVRAVNAFDDLLEAAKLVICVNDPFYEGAVSDKDAMQCLISTVAKADVPHA